MPKSGSQCWLCDLPVRYDTYEGCTHDCKYCFVRRKNSLEVRKGESVESLKRFISGERNKLTSFCDWNIPLHWGGMSDPFQPCEKEYGRSLEALKVFVETGYPVVISTKGKLCIEEPYLSLIGQADCVMQISMICRKYDVLEKGASTFAERLRMLEKLSGKAKRVIVRCQPYVHDVFGDVYENIPKFARSGAYGVIFEGMKFAKRKEGLVKRGGDWVQPKELLREDFLRFRERCHEYGMKFYSGENCLRTMGDSLTCCGTDGLENFRPNFYNLNHILNGETPEPSEAQLKTGTAECFRAINQSTSWGHFLKEHSFASVMNFLYHQKKNYIDSVMKGEKR
ncbi:MAG: radical SAM protein [Ruminococcus sp.]|nr:radical SAM protein [Ruminococcus sp.]